MQSGLSSCWLCMYSCMYVCTCMYVPPFHHTYVRIYVSMYVRMYACMDAPYPSYLITQTECTITKWQRQGRRR